MTPDQLALAKEYRDITNENIHFACRRGCELADEFSRLEVQIATILFAFAGLFLKTVDGNSLTSLNAKIAFATALFFLIASLVMGLLHIKRKEKFWDTGMVERIARFSSWSDTIRKNGDFDQAYAFHMGISKGQGGMISSPLWTWILQTIFLGIAVALLYALALLFIFN